MSWTQNYYPYQSSSNTLQHERFMPGNSLKSSAEPDLQIFNGGPSDHLEIQSRQPLNNQQRQINSPQNKKYPIIFDSYNEKKQYNSNTKYQPFSHMPTNNPPEKDQYNSETHQEIHTFKHISEQQPQTAHFLQVPQNNHHIQQTKHVQPSERNIQPSYEESRYMPQHYQERSTVEPYQEIHTVQRPLSSAYQQRIIRPPSPINTKKVVFSSNIPVQANYTNYSSPSNSTISPPPERIIQQPYPIHSPSGKIQQNHTSFVQIPQPQYKKYISQQAIVQSIQQQNIHLKIKYEELSQSDRNNWEQNQSLRQENKRLRDLVHHLELREKELNQEKDERKKIWEDSIKRGKESALHEMSLLIQRYRLELQKK